MPIWNIRPIEEEPESKLTHWSIREVQLPGEEGSTRHFVGELASWHPEGRVSSPIVSFDPETMRGVTRSGRVYQLLGVTGHSSDADYVWARWCALNHVIDHKSIDVWQN